MTAAAIVSSLGTVHRLITVAGREETACAATGPKVVTVQPAQAAVFHLLGCPACWPSTAEYGRWVHGAAT